MTPSSTKFVARLLLCSLWVAALAFPAATHADQAQYFYDELGQLVGVVDGSGNVAVYTYDEVGNLLAIQRSTTGATGIGIFVVAPNSAGGKKRGQATFLTTFRAARVAAAWRRAQAWWRCAVEGSKKKGSGVVLESE